MSITEPGGYCDLCDADTPSARCQTCGFWACAVCLDCETCNREAAGEEGETP